MRRSLSLTRTVLAAAFILSAGSAHAHVKMLKPPPWINEGDGLLGIGAGDPQKGAPCGPGGFDNVTPIPVSNIVTTFKAGETISVEWSETIPHPGYYRIALAENRADLKDPTVPFTNPDLCNVDHSKIPQGAHDNVLADGIFVTSDASSRPGYPELKFSVKLPDKPCDKCTLQLIQFMENHAPGCIYYHCADIKIVAAGAGSGDAGVGGDAGVTDAGAPGGKVDASTTDAGSTITMPGGGTAGAATLGGAAGGTVGTGGTAGTAGGTTGTTTSPVVGAAGGTGAVPPAGTAGGAPVPAASPDDDDGGCSVAFGGSRATHTGIGLGLLALTLLNRRRRMQKRTR